MSFFALHEVIHFVVDIFKCIRNVFYCSYHFVVPSAMNDKGKNFEKFPKLGWDKNLPVKFFGRTGNWIFGTCRLSTRYRVIRTYWTVAKKRKGDCHFHFPITVHILPSDSLSIRSFSSSSDGNIAGSDETKLCITTKIAIELASDLLWIMIRWLESCVEENEIETVIRQMEMKFSSLPTDSVLHLQRASTQWVLWPFFHIYI